MPSDSVEATVAAVNTITESIGRDDSILPPNDLMFNSSITIDTGTNSFSVNVEPSLTNVSTIPSNQKITTHPSPLTDAIVGVSPDSLDTLGNSTSVDPTKSINQFTEDHLMNVDQIVAPDLAVSSEDNVLNSLGVNPLNVETLSLLQQLQPSGMVVSNENDDGTIPLILDDVTLLNIELGENMQIISLSDLDQTVVPPEVI